MVWLKPDAGSFSKRRRVDSEEGALLRHQDWAYNFRVPGMTIVKYQVIVLVREAGNASKKTSPLWSRFSLGASFQYRTSRTVVFSAANVSFSIMSIYAHAHLERLTCYDLPSSHKI